LAGNNTISLGYLVRTSVTKTYSSPPAPERGYP